MAEGLLCHLSNSSVEVHSAGTKPVGVNPLAIAVMCEIGVDISAHRAKSEAEFSKQSFDTVITVCDSVAEQCPVFPGSPRRIHWNLPDPAAATGSLDEKRAAFRRVRDQFAAHLRNFLADETSEQRR